MALKSILAPQDLSANALQALRMAIDLAYRSGAELHILHVFQLTLRSSIRSLEQMIALEKEAEFEARTELQQLIYDTFEQLSPAHRQQVNVRVTVRLGSPAEEILHIAEAEASDLVVMGAKGLDDYPDKALGSTTSHIIRQKHLSVLSIPAGWKLSPLQELVYITDLEKMQMPIKLQLRKLAQALGLNPHIVQLEVEPGSKGAAGTYETFAHLRQTLGLQNAELHQLSNRVLDNGLAKLYDQLGGHLLGISANNRTVFNRFFQTNLLEDLELLQQTPLLTVGLPEPS